MKNDKLSITAKARLMAEALEKAEYTRILDLNTQSAIKVTRVAGDFEESGPYIVSFHPSGDHSWIPLGTTLAWMQENTPDILQAALAYLPARKEKGSAKGKEEAKT